MTWECLPKKVPSDVQNKKKKFEQNVAASIGMSENNNGQFNNVINQQATFFGETCHISPNIFKAWACFFVFFNLSHDWPHIEPLISTPDFIHQPS